MADFPGNIDVMALMEYLNNLQQAPTPGPMPEDYYTQGTGFNPPMLDSSGVSTGATGNDNSGEGSGLSYTERAMLANGVTMEEIMAKRSSSTPPTEPETPPMDFSKLPFMYAGGFDLESQLGRLGSFLGQEKGTEGRGLGIGASAGAFALGATRNILSGLSAQRATNVANEFYNENRDRRTYTPNPEFTNVGGGNLYAEGGMHINSDTTTNIENKDKMEHLKKYFPNGGIFGGRKKEEAKANPYEGVNWKKEEPVARPLIYDYQQTEEYQALSPYQKNIVDYQKGHRFGFDVNEGVWVEDTAIEYDYQKDIATGFGEAVKGRGMISTNDPFTGADIHVRQAAVEPLVGTFGDRYKRLASGGQFKNLFNY